MNEIIINEMKPTVSNFPITLKRVMTFGISIGILPFIITIVSNPSTKINKYNKINRTIKY